MHGKERRRWMVAIVLTLTCLLAMPGPAHAREADASIRKAAVPVSATLYLTLRSIDLSEEQAHHADKIINRFERAYARWRAMFDAEHPFLIAKMRSAHDRGDTSHWDELNQRLSELRSTQPSVIDAAYQLRSDVLTPEQRPRFDQNMEQLFGIKQP